MIEGLTTGEKRRVREAVNYLLEEAPRMFRVVLALAHADRGRTEPSDDRDAGMMAQARALVRRAPRSLVELYTEDEDVE